MVYIDDGLAMDAHKKRPRQLLDPLLQGFAEQHFLVGSPMSLGVFAIGSKRFDLGEFDQMFTVVNFRDNVLAGLGV